MHAFERSIKLDLDEADGADTCDLTSLAFGQQISGRDILGGGALQEAENAGEDGTAERAEHVDVPGVGARLRRQVRHAVAADDIATEVVSLRERQLNLRPPRYVVGAIAYLEGEVPDDTSVGLL